MVDDRTVFVVGGGLLQRYMIREAQALGLRVICSDGNPACPGAQVADAFIRLDTYNVAGHATLGKMYKGNAEFLGVVTCGADVAPSVAALAETAGVRGIPLDVAKLTHDKRAVRNTLEDAGLNCYQPEWDEYCINCQEDGIPGQYGGPYPCVVKPTEERASRGVTIVRNSAYLREAIEKASAYSSIYLIEEYLQGTEHSAEIIFGDDGAVLWWHLVDRYFDYASGIPIERGHLNPTRLDAHTQQQIFLMVLAAAKALGVSWGAWKIDAIMTKDGPKILECTARLSGGFDSQWTSPATDRHPMKLLLQLACGLPLDAQPQMDGADGYGAAAAILPQCTGIVDAIQLPLWAQSAEILRDDSPDREIILLAQPGDFLAPAQHNAARAGFVMAHGHDAQQTWDTAWQVAQDIATHIEVRPL